ncbi:hypothetical protein FNJ87_14430 [Nonlabens mediterrranea]|uniref:Uncharacterized protein n=1 Tax=Nonlabens mediterrranea TaxID=1419947 RepID=A0ABS0A7V4_9FLAO|nr:hypothetical protein [Nonlabens mediterrranea]
MFEIVFPFLFWLKRFRLPLLIIGLGLHLGILFSYPIPLFALAMINVYLLLVPISFWIKILSFFKIKPLNNDQPIKSVASFKQLSLIIFVALFFQMNTSINHSSLTRPYVFKLYNKLGIANEVDILSRKIRDFSSKTMGIFSHGVFIDKHFKGYNHIISVSYMNNGVEEWLPLINKKGMPGEMNRGANWAKLTWRTNECLINQGKLKAGIIDFCTYWAIINDKSLSGDNKFIIRVKKVELPKEYKWQKDFLKNQIDQPWSVVGSLQFHNEEPLIEILDIESF